MKKQVSIRFYEELNDFLDPKQHKQEFKVAFEDTPLLEHFIESLGVPPAEVDLILVNGHPVPFSYVLQDKDRISVYPVFETFDIATVTRLRESPLRLPKFIVDTDLGKLVNMLRIFGFDTEHINDGGTQDIVTRSLAENRTILTRNTAILRSNGVVRGYRVTQTQPSKQFSEIIRRFNLEHLINPFSRCMGCNSRLAEPPSKNITSGEVQKPSSAVERLLFCINCQTTY